MAQGSESDVYRNQEGDVLRRMTFATHSLPMPDGMTLLTKIELQEDGGVYISHSFRQKDGGVVAGETCFYCDGKKLGCITCAAGQSASANCVTRRISCVRDNAIQNWSPASLVFRSGGNPE